MKQISDISAEGKLRSVKVLVAYLLQRYLYTIVTSNPGSGRWLPQYAAAHYSRPSNVLTNIWTTGAVSASYRRNHRLNQPHQTFTPYSS